MTRWSPHGQLRWLDAVIVAFVTVSSVAEASVVAGGFRTAAVAAATAAGAALAVRHRWPVVSAAASVVAAGGWGLVMPLLVSLFTLASRGRRVTAVAAAAAALVVNTVIGREPGTAESVWSLRSYGPVLLLTVAALLGVWADNRRRLVNALNADLAHAAHERELRTEAARMAERTAIAAEMHDVLAHRLSLIALHTGNLMTRTDTLSAPVLDRIALVRSASTDALVELRDVLAALRAPQSAPVALNPTLRSVADIVGDARAGGQGVDVDIDGDPAGIPTAHRLAVLRVVQESLTNARKHAASSPVSVRVQYGPPLTEVTVRNARCGDDPPIEPPHSGFGLIGLRERVTALGGALRVGGHAEWYLQATIPTPADATVDHP